MTASRVTIYTVIYTVFVTETPLRNIVML